MLYVLFSMGENTGPAPRLDAQLFRDVFNASPIGIAVENLDGQPLFVNPAFCSMLGFSEEELRSKHCVDFSPPEDAQKDWALFQQLRAGSIDHYQLDKRYFRRDGSLVWGSLSISLLNSPPSPLVIAMVEDITAKKTAEEALRASEERLRLAQQAARIGTFERDIRTGVNTWTPDLESMYGLSPGSFSGTQTAFENLVHRDDRAGVVELVDGALKTGEPTSGEWRVVWPDGSVHWIAGRWQVFMNDSGEPSRMIGINIEITERKLAEEALATVSHRLIEAQEQERSRLARELHDNINQKLAMLGVRLEGLKEGLAQSAPDLERQMGEAYEQVVAVGNEVQSLSHRLHSPKLGLLGLAATTSSFCKEFSAQQKVETDFQSENVPKELPQEIALCLFRVLQEALQNAAKHSGSRHFQVALRGGTNEIELIVHDSGIGFDPEESIKGRGLGLTSMKERLNMVDGQLSIDSKLQQGTTIHARVPLHPRMKSARTVE